MANINEISMDVILHAGNGRMLIDEALEKMVSLEFEEAKKILSEAEKEVIEAHTSQTKVIQSQVAGEDTEYSLLFIHAQDTIMTINTELRIAEKFLKVFEALKKECESNGK